MKPLFSKLLIAALFMVATVGSALAQIAPTVFLLKAEGIPGESTVDGHAGEIDLASFKLGVEQHGVTDFGGKAGAGKSVFSPLKVFKNVDKSSPIFFLKCAKGEHIPKVELTALRQLDGGNQEYLKIVLVDVLVSSVNHESAEQNGTDILLESISLNFSKIELTYTPFNSDGTAGSPVKAAFDVKANKALIGLL